VLRRGTRSLLSLHVALRGAVAQLQTIVSLLMWRTGGKTEDERSLAAHAKLALDAARALEEIAPPAPEGTDLLIRSQGGTATRS
jgi:hypothetical protein